MNKMVYKENRAGKNERKAHKITNANADINER